MFKIFQITFLAAILITVMSINQTFAQECINEETFESYTIGQTLLPPQSGTGYFAAYGEVLVVDQNCTPGGDKSIQLKANNIDPNGQLGSAVVYKEDGIAGLPTFEAGKMYHYSFKKLLSSATIGDFNLYENPTLTVALTNDLECTGSNCQILSPSPKSVSELADGNCYEWGDPTAITFTAEQDYTYIIFYVEATWDNADLSLFVNLDDICVEEVIQNECEAAFEYVQEDCGKVQFTGIGDDVTSWRYEFSGPAFMPDETTQNPCVLFPANGNYAVTLTVTCMNGSTFTTDVELITIDNVDNTAPVIGYCPDSLVIVGNGPECEGVYTPDFQVVDNNDPSATYSYGVYVDGIYVPEGTSVNLSVGVHNVRGIFEDPCGNKDSCLFELTIECPSEYDCTDFDDESLGGWYRYNNDVAGGNIVFTLPAGLAGPGPSGIPSDLYLQASDLGGSTWLVNDVDYVGDWKEYIGQCFCFDFTVFNDGGSNLPVAPAFFLTSAFDPTQPIVFGVNPVNAIRWKATTTLTQGAGWDNFCIDVDTCDSSGNLPLVNDGSWSYVNNSATSTCQDFNDLLCNVENVMFSLDLIDSPTEVYGFDNICTGPCPPPPNPCEFSVDVDTLSQANGECCYELDFSANTTWSYVDFDLQTPGVIFNTAMVDPAAFDLDTLSNGTKLRVTGKNPGFGGYPPVTALNFMNFCFANVDSAAQAPQCVVVNYYAPGPLDYPIIACSDTLKFDCMPPNDDVEECLAIDLEAICDEDEIDTYKLTFSVTNLTAANATGVTLTSQDPNVNFLPIGAPAGAIPQASVYVSFPALAPSNTQANLMVLAVSSVPVIAPTVFCLEGHLRTADGCCTSPDHFCTTLPVCCDPCEQSDIFVQDISGTSLASTFSFGASHDGDLGFVQIGFLGDVTAPTMRTSTYDATVLSDGVQFRSFIDFDFEESLCEGAVVTSAQLKLFADPTAQPHNSSVVDDSCLKLRRVIDPWTETTLGAGTYPNASTTNEVSVDSPDFPYEDYTIDVTALVNDILANPATGHGFELSATCADKVMFLNFSTKDNPNTSLHPQLIITIDDEDCPNPVLEGDCCHSIDLINECETDFFTKVELKSITPGVNIGSHRTGGVSPQDWNIASSTPNCIEWKHNSGYIPSGTTNDLIEFCLSDIDPTEVPQDVVLHWYALDGNGQEYIACSDTMSFDCEPPVDNPCIAVLDTQLKGSPCDSLDCFEQPFCLQWLRDTVSWSITAPEFQSYNTIEKGFWNGQPVFVATNPTAPGAANIGNTDIFLCDGTLIQSCAITIAGEVCNPNLNIDPFSDITSKTLIWMTGDPLPPLDPDCASGTGGSNIIDVCLTFKNTSNHYASDFIIYPITPGVNYWPNPIAILPSGANSCDTATVDFQLYGSAIIPGATVKFGVRLADHTNPDDWCCFETDTVCVSIPTCPPADECCESIDTFNNLIAQGFQITDLGNCTYQVCTNQFDDCHWWPNVSPT